MCMYRGLGGNKAIKRSNSWVPFYNPCEKKFQLTNINVLG